MSEQEATMSSLSPEAPDPPNPTFPTPSVIGTTATAQASPAAPSAPATQPQAAVNATTPFTTQAATCTPDASNAPGIPAVTSSSAVPAPLLQFGHGFDPSIGGDIITRSIDNTFFMSHSTLLCTVSPSFNKMIPPSEARATSSYYPLPLPYHSSILIIILQLLYQRPLPPSAIVSFSMLNGCLRVSTMYNLDSVTAYLRNLLWTDGTLLSITHSPVDAYALGAIFGFERETTAAFQRCIEVVDLRYMAGVNSVISRCVNPGIALPLICRLARRNTIILETLGALHVFPMDLRSPHWWDTYEDWEGHQALVCNTCRSDVVFNVPSWQLFWAQCAKKELLKHPGSRCDYVFKVHFLCMTRNYGADLAIGNEATEGNRLAEQPKTCTECLQLIVLDNGELWEEWADEVRLVLSRKLGDDF